MTEASQDAQTPDTVPPAADPARKRRGSRGGRRGGNKQGRPVAAPGDTAATTDASAADAVVAVTTPGATSAPRQGHKDKRTQPPQAARKVNPILERLFELYPALFGARFVPLKLGVFEDLAARHPDVLPREELKVAMGLHARSTRYLESVAAGLPRHDLDGNVVEPVAAEHVHHAIMEVFRRRQTRTKDDLRPQLHKRIMAAIEASGLTREAYAERVRARDDVTNAALDEALADLASQAAKREALMRAFQASGKTEAEFADMYGMDVKEVARTLQRVRKDEVAAQAAAAQAAAAQQADPTT
ncbi:ProQ/FINO family protein [Variovorax ginsengisoli]|uniref:SRNA-binding protein n=1 Tax=Variovorax ginsengisoli TaxID=363844 RepID=A0ABT9SBB6_9BURK|nr:ProQ/FINO family protein [Variovorax ginsengisoli]MDP9901649.1 sRNA-binding protein [Variovorax ginsengisoli]